MNKKNHFLADMGSEVECLSFDMASIRDIFGVLRMVLMECENDPRVQGYASVALAAICLTDDCILRADNLAESLCSSAQEVNDDAKG